MMAACAALSHRGLVRESNQDRFFIDPDRGIYIVADGMGCLPGGAVAAQLVVDHLPRLLTQRLQDNDDLGEECTPRLACSAITELNLAVRHRHGISQGMGTTVVLAWISGAHALIGSLGDSRAYLLHQRRLTRLTTDHCLAELLLHSGDLTSDQAAKHPTRRQLTRYVGMDGDATPDAQVITLASGDRLLLCTDGLTTMVADRQIEAILKDQRNPDAVCRVLIDTANTADGNDNITVIVIDC
ncbi:MAG: serine/threonine-protein phosphatase [Pseudonocardiales bacterium]|nr:serine/threonine-protein phosphatase [Pseudonocardiales bacterium]